MTSVKKILGVKEEKQTLFVSPERQSPEQVEDYSTRKVVQSKEIYLSDGAAAGFVKNDANGKLIGGQAGGGVSGLTTDVIPKAASSSTLADSALTESSTEITSTKDLWIKDNNGILFDKTGGGGTQTLRIKGTDDSSSTTGISGLRHLVIQCDSGNNDRQMFFKSYNTNFMIGGSGGLLITTSSTYSGKSASAFLQVDSTTKGFLPPRMTTTEKNAISSPATGLMVFDTTLGKVCVYTGAAWETMTSA